MTSETLLGRRGHKEAGRRNMARFCPGNQPIRRAVGIFLTAIGLATLPQTALGGPETATPPAPHSITAAIPADFPPHYSLDDTGEPTGFAIDVFEALAARLNMRIHYVVRNTWSDVDESFRTGKADVIPNMGITAERSRYGIFTAPVETFNVSLFSRKTALSIQSLDDLAGHHVGAVKTNAAVKLLAAHPEIVLTVFDNLPTAFYALMAGHIDALAYPEPALWAFAASTETEGRIKAISPPLAEIKRAILVRKDSPALAAALNTAVKEFVGSRQYESIYAKWYRPPPPFWTPLWVLIAASGCAVVVIAAILLWTTVAQRRLNRSLVAAAALREADQEKLRVSEQKYRSLFYDSPVAHLAVDPHSGAIRNCNPATAALSGYSLDELTAMSVFALSPDLRHKTKAAAKLLEHVQNGQPIQGAEVALRRRDGALLRIALSANPIFDAERNVVELRAVLSDTTALKKAEDEIRASEGRFQALAAGMPAGIMRVDAQGTVSYVNEAWSAQSGIPADDVVGVKGVEWCRAAHPDDHERVSQSWRSVLSSGKPASCEFRWARSGDGSLWAACTAVPEFGIDGHPIGVVGSFTDVSALKTLQLRLEASEERFALAMRGANDGLWDWNLVTNEVYFSPRWKEMIGYGDSELANDFNEWERRLHPDDVGQTLDEIQAHIRGETEAFHVEFRMHHKDGHWVDILGRGFLARDDAGKPARFVGTHVDISELKRQERELIRLVNIRETISNCNRVLVKTTDEEVLVGEMCKILANLGEFALAWIGMAGEGPDHPVRPAAAAGPATPFVDKMAIQWKNDEYGHEPASTALQTGRVQVKQNLLTSSSFAPWRDVAEKWSLRSAIALPLMNEGGKPFGVLNVYSTVPDAFDDMEIDVLKEFASDLALGVRSIRARAERRQAQDALSQTLLGTIDAISRTVEKRDPYTAGHQRNVANLAVAIAKKLGWSDERAEGLRLGAMIHDIGKIYVPAEILNRPGRLSEAEFNMIKSHPEVGAEIVSGVRFPWPVGDMILQHHERLDGSGYPRGLKGDEIIKEARILCVADVVEAITAHRPYRASLGIENGIAEIRRGRGTLYDPDAVYACIEIVTDHDFNWQSGA